MDTFKFILFISCVIVALTSMVVSEDIQVFNNCPVSIYVKNEGGNVGPFWLNKGDRRTFQVRRGDPKPRVWAHFGCDGNGWNCETNEGEVSLAEMHWDNSGWTWYDISHVDAFNIPLTMTPYNSNLPGRCGQVGCYFRIENCPGNARKYKDGRLVACVNPNRDDGNTAYAQGIRRECPGSAYSWSKDDRSGMRDCHPGNSGLVVQFC